MISGALAITPSRLGELTITELQADPQEVAQYYGEWFEVYNNYPGTVDLIGVTFVTSSGSFTVERSLAVGVDGYVVFAVSGETTSTAASYNGGVTADYTYSFVDVNLSLSGDSIRAYNGATLLDEVVWTSAWSITRDAAHQASLNAFDVEWANDLSHNWCSAGDRYGANDMFGTPGAANSYCSADPGRDTDGDGWTETDGDCDDDADCDGVRDDGDLDGYSPVDGDCDDTDTDTHPGAVDVVDGEDNDCDGCVDGLDVDGDGFGSGDGCGPDNCPDDANADQADADQDGVGDVCDTCTDVDGDGYGGDATTTSCERDCDDTDASVHPDAPDYCDGVDSDCDGSEPEEAIWYPDADGDGYGTDGPTRTECSQAIEMPGNGIDEDCNRRDGDDEDDDGDDDEAKAEPGCDCNATPAAGAWMLAIGGMVTVRRRRYVHHGTDGADVVDEA